MAEIDPVILQLRADVAKYRVDVENTTRRVNTQLDSQGQAVVRLERQFSASSAKISTSARAIATSLAAGFSAREVAAMADSYTRFTNQLKVAGLEGGNLAGTQERLFQVAQKNGVELEAVGTLYSRAAQNQKELGASTSDLVDLTRAVSASLRISGTSTNEASGALLQLGQALGSPRVQAEEFNSLLDTMQPLLRQASQYIDGTGGSLAGLTQKIKDTKGPGVSNVELFRAIIRAMSDLEKQAASTTLTISGAFTNLTNAITKFIGETDSANGATATITGAINLLADNLDTVTEALAVLSAVMLGRFVAGMVGGAAATGVASTAIFALQARAAGAATTMEALAFAGSTAGRSLLAAFGGPVGLAVTALTVGIGYLYNETAKADAAAGSLKATIDAQTASLESVRAAQVTAAAETNKLTSEQRAALTATANLTGEADKLAEAWGRVAAQAKAASVEQARATLSKARTAAIQARDSYNARVQRELDNPANRPIAERGLSKGVLNDPAGALASARKAAGAEKKLYDDAVQNVVDFRKQYNEEVEKPLASFKPAPAAAPPATDTKKGGKKASGKTGPDPADVARRFDDDLAAGQMAILQAQADAIGTADARRGLEHDQIEYERARNRRQIKADTDTTNAQKEQLLLQNDRIAEERRKAVGAEALREAQESQRRAADNSAQYAQEALRADASLAATRQASLAANLRILDSLEAQEKLHLEAQIAVGEIADAEKARADLARTQAARRTTTQQDHESPLEQRRRQVRETAANMGDAIENIEVDAIDRLTDGLGKASAQYLKLGGIAGDVINGIISDLVKLAAKQAIMNLLPDGTGGPGGDSNFLSSIGSFLGISGARANGGPVSSGRTYLVGERGPELFTAPSSGKIVPNNMLNTRAAASMAGVTAAGVAGRSVQQPVVVKVEANDYFDARVDGRAAKIATPIASRQSRNAAGASYAAGQQSAPGTINKYNQLKG
ncbi:tape measure protein [Novosphingobium sp. RL4]|uniref:tape measure protein n=1 Tax=Novosphingobium sp. RL4 TaxID=3109595 RepID=UPI002D777779|nr:tape measure protein [Novosphingobium sp. RL4]WRT91926.1 tape measure protein [Novosphingobium sp. RL4]